MSETTEWTNVVLSARSGLLRIVENRIQEANERPRDQYSHLHTFFNNLRFTQHLAYLRRCSKRREETVFGLPKIISSKRENDNVITQ